MMARAILAHWLKDWRLTLRDRGALALGLLLPVALVLGFGFVYQTVFGASGGLERTKARVLDADGTEASRRFAEGLSRADTLSAEIEEVEDERAALEKARRLVRDGDEHHVIVLGEGFAEALASGRIPPISVVRDPGRALEAQLVAIALLQAFFSVDAAALSEEWTVRALVQAGLPEPLVERARALTHSFRLGVSRLFEEEASAGEAAADEEEVGAADRSFDFGETALSVLGVRTEEVAPPGRPRQLTFWLAHNVAGIATMMLMFGLVGAASLLLAEAEGGTLARAFLAPVPRTSVLWAKFLHTVTFGLVQLGIVYAVAEAVFRVGLFRSPATLAVVSLTLVFCVSSCGVLLATLARTPKQAEGLATVVILLMSAIGGAWFPIQMVDLPPLAETVARATITWWAVEAYHGLLWYGRGLGDAAILRDLAVLAAVGAVALLLARRAFVARYLSA